MNTDKELNVGRITFGSANVPNATVTHYQLQLAKQQISELRITLLNVTKELTTFCDQSDLMPDDCAKAITVADALLAKLDAEDKTGKSVT